MSDLDDPVAAARALWGGAKSDAARRSLQVFIERTEPPPRSEPDAVATPPAAAKKPGKVSTVEDDFQGDVVRYGREKGWRMQATLRSRQHALVTEPGWPDLFMWHPELRTFACAELKRALDAGATGAQVRVAGELAWCGVRFFVWTPKDWPAIRRFLDGDVPYRATHTATVADHTDTA